jgi:outer membrane protein OmpA-like peptidoglycan-associated protein
MVGVMMILACTPHKSIFVLIPDPGGKVGRITVSNETGAVTLTTAGATAEIADGKITPHVQKSISPEAIDATFHDAIKSYPRSSVRYTLYFKHGISELTESSQRSLTQIVNRINAAINDCHGCDILVVGHTDTNGSDAFNEKLGLARAKKMAEKLIDLGIPPDRTGVMSHGEKNLFISTADSVPEPRNRRVEVIVR